MQFTRVFQEPVHVANAVTVVRVAELAYDLRGWRFVFEMIEDPLGVMAEVCSRNLGGRAFGG
jgi:hypothetical protein